MHKTVTVFGQGQLLSYSSKFAWKFHSFTHFLNMFFQYSMLFFVFSCSLFSFNNYLIYSSSIISKGDAIVTEIVLVTTSQWHE